MPDATRYRLVVDLASYHPSFRAGAEGVYHGASIMGDQFFTMRLDDGSKLSVLWRSVERVAS